MGCAGCRAKRMKALEEARKKKEEEKKKKEVKKWKKQYVWNVNIPIIVLLLKIIFVLKMLQKNRIKNMYKELKVIASIVWKNVDIKTQKDVVRTLSVAS